MAAEASPPPDGDRPSEWPVDGEGSPADFDDPPVPDHASAARDEDQPVLDASPPGRDESPPARDEDARGGDDSPPDEYGAAPRRDEHPLIADGGVPPSDAVRQAGGAAPEDHDGPAEAGVPGMYSEPGMYGDPLYGARGSARGSSTWRGTPATASAPEPEFGPTWPKPAKFQTAAQFEDPYRTKPQRYHPARGQVPPSVPLDPILPYISPPVPRRRRSDWPVLAVALVVAALVMAVCCIAGFAIYFGYSGSLFN
jgi:hypothetical protein